MRSRWQGWAAADRGFALALLGFLPLAAWWLGWFPGWLSTDSTDQWDQLMRFDISNQHPAFHTWLMWLVSRIWVNPGMVTLVQIVAMTLVLAVVARRLVELGAQPWAGSLWVFGIAALPAVGISTIALFKDVPFTIAMVWALAELLGYVARPERWPRVVPAVRLGTALALVWLLRHNGFITVVIIGLGLVWRLRRERRALVGFIGALVLLVAAVNLVLYPLIGVERASIQPATVFISDVAASLVHEPENFTDAELEYVASIAPIEVWDRLYDCADSTPLVFSPEFDKGIIVRDPAKFRELVVATYLRDTDTVLGHRWCAASYLVEPWQHGDAYFHRPPFEIPLNDYGIVRHPVSDRAFSFTFAIYKWVEAPGRMWFTWRPALAVWAVVVALALAVRRKRATGMALPALLLAAHFTNVAITTPAHDFRFAFPIYLMSLVLVGATVLRGPQAGSVDQTSAEADGLSSRG